MKYKDWIIRNSLPPDAKPIFCPDCGEYIGDERDYMFMLITSPIVCPKCDEIVIYPNSVTYMISVQN